MTDRIRSLTVALDDDYRDDDLTAIVAAIEMVKGVLNVEHGAAVTPKDWVNREAVRQEFRVKLLEIIWPKAYGTEGTG